MCGRHFVLFAAITFLLSGSVLPVLLPEEAMPDIWLVSIIIAVLAFDRKTVLALAGVGGVLADVVTGNFFGLHLFPYLVTAGLALCAVREKYNRKWLVSLLAVMAGTLVCMLVFFLVIHLGMGHAKPFYYFFYRGLPQFVSNAAAALVMHCVLWNMKREWEPRW